MITKTGDYVIIATAKNKMLTVLVTSDKDNAFKGVVDNEDRGSEATAEEVTFERQDIFANLGKTPKHGQVYGVTVEPWVKQKQIRPWTQVNVFTELNETEEKTIFDGLKTCGSVLQQRGLIAPKPIHVEIRPPKGKYEGMYKWVSKADSHDTMTLRIKTFEEVNYFIYHEMGHHVWWNLMTVEHRNVWAEAFIKSSILREVTKTDLKEYLQNLKDSGSCKSFRAKAEDEQEEVVIKEIFKYIWTRHAVDWRIIDSLLEAEKFDQIDLLFPTRSSLVGNKEILVSDYSTKNVHEFFAETFAYYMSEKELNKSMRIMLKKTFKELGI